MPQEGFPLHLVPRLGPDPAMMAATYELQAALEMLVLAAVEDGCRLSGLSQILTDIALLSADLRRN